jgi:hypothetical protein
MFVSEGVVREVLLALEKAGDEGLSPRALGDAMGWGECYPGRKRASKPRPGCAAGAAACVLASARRQGLAVAVADGSRATEADRRWTRWILSARGVRYLAQWRARMRAAREKT